jgi:hypothetical protein
MRTLLGHLGDGTSSVGLLAGGLPSGGRGLSIFGPAQLGQLFVGNLSAGGSLLDVLRRGFWEYYQFSKAQPEHFALMFADRSVPRIMEDWARFGFLHTTVQNASDQIRACMELGDFPPDTVPEVAFHILWAAMHGVAMIGLYGMFAPGEDPDALARDTFEAALTGLRTGIRTTFAAADLGKVGSLDPAAGATNEPA